MYPEALAKCDSIIVIEVRVSVDIVVILLKKEVGIRSVYTAARLAEKNVVVEVLIMIVECVDLWLCCFAASCFCSFVAMWLRGCVAL